MRIKLQTTLDVVLAISAAVVAVVLVAGYLRGDGGKPPRAPALLRIGDKIPNIPGVDFKAADRTLLLGIRSSCSFCTTSMPFYRRLVTERGPQTSLRLVAVGAEDSGIFKDYVRQNNLAVDQAVVVDNGPFRSSPTPTLVLADRTQRVAGIWVGRLSSDREQALMKASGLCEACSAVVSSRNDQAGHP